MLGLLVCPGGLRAQEENETASFKTLPRDILEDQKFFWVRPFRPKAEDWPWLVGGLGTTAALFAIDRPVGQELSDTPPGDSVTFSRRVGQSSGVFVSLGIAGSFYLVGRWREDKKARTTSLQALRSVTSSLIIVEVLKVASQRPRPTRANGRVRNHNADGEFFAGGRSFPSGHAIRNWALATVIAHRYSDHAWVPPTAYGLAGLVAVSRVTARKHFPSDVFVGSFLGFLIGRHIAHSGQADQLQARRWRLEPGLLPNGAVGVQMQWQF